MFGRDTKEKDVGDVVVEDAEDVVIENPEDVFVEEGAVEGEIRVENVGDVHVQSGGSSQADPHRDYVADDGETAELERCEDVLVKQGSVSGDLVVKDTIDDVFLQDTTDATVTRAEDIFVNNRSVTEGDSVEVVDSEDVWVHDGGVDGDITATDPDDILQRSPGAVSEGVDVGDVEDTGDLHLVDTGDLLVETGGVSGEIEAESPGDVLDDVSF